MIWIVFVVVMLNRSETHKNSHACALLYYFLYSCIVINITFWWLAFYNIKSCAHCAHVMTWWCINKPTDRLDRCVFVIYIYNSKCRKCTFIERHKKQQERNLVTAAATMSTEEAFKWKFSNCQFIDVIVIIAMLCDCSFISCSLKSFAMGYSNTHTHTPALYFFLPFEEVTENDIKAQPFERRKKILNSNSKVEKNNTWNERKQS